LQQLASVCCYYEYIKYTKEISMAEVPKKKITLEGLKNAFKLYNYIKPFRVEYAWGMFFLLGSSIASLAFPKLLG